MLNSSGADNGRDDRPTILRRLLPMGGAVVGVAAFAILARESTRTGAITAFDARYLAMRQLLVTPGRQRFYLAFTLLGSPALMTVLALIGALWLGVRRLWAMWIGWSTAFIGAALIVQMTKRTIHHPRPSGAAQFLHGISYSFPSGHVVGSLVGFGMLAYVLSRVAVRRTLPKLTLHFLATWVVATIAWSRIYLGVHFVSDVLGGIAIGSAWLILCVIGTEWLAIIMPIGEPPSAKCDP